MRTPFAARNSAKYIAAGFALVLMSMLAVSAIGISHTSNIHRRLESIVNEHNAKTDLVMAMRQDARERMILLHEMLLSDDLFELDEFHNRFLEHAARFNVSRTELEAIPLSSEERALLQRLRPRTEVAGAVRREIMDLIAAGRKEQAKRTLLADYIPSQNATVAVLDELLSLQRTSTRSAAAQAADYYRHALAFMGGFGLAFLALGLLVAWHVRRLVARAQDAVLDEKELALVTLHSIGEAVIATDARGHITAINPVAESLTGWTAADARGQALDKVLQLLDETSHAAISLLPAHIETGASRRAILMTRERRYSIESTAAPIRRRDGEVIGHILVFRDVSKAQYLAQQLNWQATHDALTGLLNRREFEHRLTQLLSEAKSNDKVHGLLYLDLDQFKVVNDTCGHIAGDELLTQLSLRLKQCVRDNDVVARLGGDEFGVLLEGCPAERAHRIAEDLRAAVQGFRFTWVGKAFELGVSIGVVTVTAASESIVELMSLADSACYAAKDAGRNRVHIYRPNDRALVRRRGEMEWLARIQGALTEGRFHLRYQAIHALAPAPQTGAHYEILLTMRDEHGNDTLPSAFIPAAEHYGMMPTIDRWVIRELFSQQAPIWQEGRDACRSQEPCNYLYGINLSGTSLSDDSFLPFLLAEMAHYAIPPHMLCFEITETAAIVNLKKASRFVQELRARGCRFALDDFGKGMSSFGYLKALPVDFVKIDGSFVRDIADNPADLAMVDAINRIGHTFNLRTIAESVESVEAVHKLRTLGVDFAQGFALHRPEALQPATLPGAAIRTG